VGFFFLTTVSSSGIASRYATQRDADVSHTYTLDPTSTCVVRVCVRACVRAPPFSSVCEILRRGLSRVQIADLASSPLSMARRWTEWLLRLFRLLRPFARGALRLEIKNRYKFRWAQLSMMRRGKIHLIKIIHIVYHFIMNKCKNYFYIFVWSKVCRDLNSSFEFLQRGEKKKTNWRI